ncbi:MAG: hypothetical protein IT178_18550 [Acidobacteria bacterium]|nr:hypothetical protein [Acidobacteriota bacterium]
MSQLFQDLAANFPTADRAAWRELVQAALKGRAFDAALVRRTGEGLTLQPLYDRDDRPPGIDSQVPGVAPFTRGWPQAGTSAEPRRGWTRGVDIAHPDVHRANAMLLADLDGGAERASVRVASAARLAALNRDRARAIAAAGDEGVWMADAADVETLLNDVQWTMAPVALVAPLDDAFSERLFAMTNGLRAAKGAGLFVQLDVTARATQQRDGRDTPEWLRAHAAHMRAEVTRTSAGDAGPWDARPLLLSSTGLRFAGADVVQELAAVIGAFVDVARALESTDLSPAACLRACEFQMAVGSDFFTEIAKLRAFRRCLALVLDTLGISDRAVDVRLSTITAAETLTRRDAYVNLLRTTTQAAAAVIGGADALSVRPFDARVAGGSLFGRRLARNLQSLLAEETDTGAVTDPAGGSFYIERRTEELAEAAWTQFVEWERAGGFFAACRHGIVATAIDERWRERRARIRARREPVLGVTVFAPAADTPPKADAFDVDAFVDGWRQRLGTTHASAADGPVDPVRHYLADDFEALRDRADAVTARTGTPPAILAVISGTPASYAARLDWVRDLVATAGVRLIEHTTDEAASGVAAFTRAQQAHAAIIVSADALHASFVPVAATALRQAGVAYIAMAGRPGDQESAYRSAGVDSFAVAGMDAYQFLDTLLNALESSHVAS